MAATDLRSQPLESPNPTFPQPLRLNTFCTIMLVSTFFVQAIFATAAFAFPSSKTRFDSRAVLGTASATLQDSPVTSSDTGISVTDAFAGAIVHSDSVRKSSASLAFSC